MRNIEIDLAERFETIWASVLALPAGCGVEVRHGVTKRAELKQVIRALYEAANGRQVETNIGLVAIAPPAFEFLKAKPFRVATQVGFLVEAAARLIAGPRATDVRDEITETVVGDRSGYKAPVHYRPAHRIRIPVAANAGSSL